MARRTACILKLLTVIIITCSFVVASCRSEDPPVVLSVNGRPLAVEIARSERQRRTGLMNRDELNWNSGMLFVFEDDRVLSFWMKNTRIPLSIAFIDKYGKVTDIFDMKPYSLETVTSTRKCRYAIEVNRGFFEESGLDVGDTIDLSMLK
jgi:uncharacterized membrane protein (UPF0127 family)